MCIRDSRKSGDIYYLGNLAVPDIAIVLNAGDAHIGEFGGYDKIVETKGELYKTIKDKGVAVLNLDDPASDKWIDMIPGDTKILRYSTRGENRIGSDLFISDCKLLPDHSHFKVNWKDDVEEVYLPLAGAHNVSNAAAAISASLAAGASLKQISAGIAKVSGGSGRMHSIELVEQIKVLDDSYNANPSSMTAAASILSLIHI